MKIDMLEVKKDRVIEIDKQIKKSIKNKDWGTKAILEYEKNYLLIQIQKIEMLRGDQHA